MDSIWAALLNMAARDWLVMLFGFFGGGLAGAGFTQFIGWLRRPKLNLYFSSSVRGCVVDPPGYLPDPDEDKPLLDANQQPVIAPTRYLRVKIQNTGRTVVHGVALSVTKLTHWRETTGTEEFDEEIMDLPVARHAQQLDLPPGGYRYMDVFSAWDHGGPSFRFSFVNQWDRIYLREYGFGSYRADIIATAENISKAKTMHIDWHWDRHGATIP